MKPHTLLVTLGIAILSFVVGVEMGRRTVPRPRIVASPPPAPPTVRELIPDGPAPRGDVTEQVKLLEPVEPHQVGTPPLHMPAAPKAALAEPAPLAKPMKPPAAIKPAPPKPDPVVTPAAVGTPAKSAPLIRIVQRSTPAAAPRPPKTSPVHTATGLQPRSPQRERWQLDIAPAARTPTSVQPVPAAAPPVRTSGPQFVVQVISVRDRVAADERATLLTARGVPAFVEPTDLGVKGTWYRVLAGGYPSEVEAKATLTTLQTDPQYAASFVRAY